MADAGQDVTLKKVLGAIIFASTVPLTVKDIRTLLQEVAAADPSTALFGQIKEGEIESVLAEMQAEWAQGGSGSLLTEVGGTYRVQSDPCCGPWIRHLLHAGKPIRLSRPALETLAIIAYRQPVNRAEIEGVRGVAVDHILRLLMELQLVRITGRSDLPGRPLLYGTTPLFLEHFGLKDLKDLPGIEELSRRAAEAAAARMRAAPEETAPAGETPAAEETPAAPPAAAEETSDDADTTAGEDR